jgi:bacteriocin biosynthesis cyclodehydratase domain-containing protein
MAAALRVKQTKAPSQALVGVGPFGRRVADIIVATEDSVVSVDENVDEAFSREPAVVIAAMWRPCVALCRRADELARKTGVAWLPVTMEHPLVRIGPLIIPEYGPCHECYRRRRAQHDPQYRTRAALDDAYEANPDLGPRGYLPHHARITAGVTETIIHRYLGQKSIDIAAQAGVIATVRLFELRISEARVIACYDCAQCQAQLSSPR